MRISRKKLKQAAKTSVGAKYVADACFRFPKNMTWIPTKKDKESLIDQVNRLCVWNACLGGEITFKYSPG